MSTPTNRASATAASPARSNSNRAAVVTTPARSNEVMESKNRKADATTLLDIVDRALQKYPLMAVWKSRRSFLAAQGHVLCVLAVAYAMNNWPISYPREDNHNEFLFWTMMMLLLGATLYTLKHEPNTRRVQLLSRAQTEEWKGWMQFVFIMYHYYRNRTIYNEIRLLVSAYVWMTGFGHFLYCDKKQDFSLERMVSMWVRINYFPILLSVFLNVKLELYYVVPLHTVGFFMALGTCYLAKVLREKHFNGDAFKSNVAAIGISLLVHILFFETSLHSMVLGVFSKEYVFRFSTDKYSAWVGVLSGFLWSRFQAYMQWCYGEETNNESTNAIDNTTAGITMIYSSDTTTTEPPNPQKLQAMYLQRAGGVGLILAWYFGFGNEGDKHVYNPRHPFIFWMPLAGWLLVRNSSKYLTELHSTVLEFMGRITLETYVLQFHVFMCQSVQHIPVVIPGSGVSGYGVLKLVNMVVTGAGFLALAWYARRATVTTQTSITELVTEIKNKYFPPGNNTAGGTEDSGLMKTKPTLGIIEDPEEVTPLVKDKKDEEP